jgi:hypothetical protein
MLLADFKNLLALRLKQFFDLHSFIIQQRISPGIGRLYAHDQTVTETFGQPFRLGRRSSPSGDEGQNSPSSWFYGCPAKRKSRLLSPHGWQDLPNHGNRDMARPLMREILREISLSPDEFVKLMEEA